MPTPRPQPTSTGGALESRGAQQLLEGLWRGLLASKPEIQDRMIELEQEREAAEEAENSDNFTNGGKNSAPRGARVSIVDLLSANGANSSIGRLTVEHLRALDANHTDQRTIHKAAGGVRGAPKWLSEAQSQAKIELRDWHGKRGLLLPEDETDPGDPTPNDEATDEAAIPYPRPTPSTPYQHLVEYLKCRLSVVYFIDNYCNLSHKEGGVIPFRLWKWQAWLLYRWRANSKVVNLKARQIGVSELAAGYAYWLIRFHDTKTALLLSIGEKEAGKLLDRAKTMAAFIPRWLAPGDAKALNPNGVDSALLVTDNATKLAIAHLDRQNRSHLSSIESLPATQRQGRSLTAALLVLDELAEMEWGRQIWQAAAPAAEGGGQVLAISTAHGRANIMYDLYDGAIKQVNGFFPVFLSWRRHPDRDEAWYERHRIDAEYRNVMHELHQEYPANDMEAFVASARQLFDNTVLARHQERIHAEMAQRGADGLPVWAEIEGLTTFEEPLAGHDYIIGADVAEGKEKGDYSDASVVCRQTGCEVAALRGHWPVEVYAQKLDELGYRYNNALLAVERNNHGLSVITSLTNGTAHERWTGARVDYNNLYHYKPEAAPGFRQMKIPGWHTNLQTKPLMIDSLLRGLREENGFLPRSQQFLREATDFEVNEDGNKMGAPSGRHDDAVISRAIAVYLLLLPDASALALNFIREYKARVEAAAGIAPKPAPVQEAVPAAIIVEAEATVGDVVEETAPEVAVA